MKPVKFNRSVDMPAKKKLAIPPVLVGKINLPEPAVKALEFLHKEENNSYYYAFEYGVITKDGGLHLTDNNACHAAMKRMPKDCGAIWSKFPRPGHGYRGDVANMAQETLNFNDWLLHRSPWAKVFVPTTTEFATKKGFVVADLNQAANLIVNALIATRIPSEHYWQVAWWNKLVKGGCPETMAFILSVAFSDDGIKRTGSIGHHPMDPFNLSMKAVEAFMRGDPKGCNQPYSQSQHYQPCNTVWGGGRDPAERYDYHKNAYGTYIEREYPVKPSASKRLFRVDGDEMQAKYPLARLVEIGITEEKRIMKDVKLEEQRPAEAGRKRLPRKRKAA